MITKESADKIESFSYMRNFTPEEMAEMKDNLAKHTIEEMRLSDELSELSKKYKEKIKPHTDKIQALAVHLKNKAELVVEECFVEFNRELGIAYVYNCNGEQVGQRPMDKEEREQLVIPFGRKTGTND